MDDEMRDQLTLVLKKLSMANRQLLSVANHVLSLSTGDVVTSQIRAAREALSADNTTLVDDQRAASTTTNMQYVKSLVYRTASLSNSSAYLVGLCKTVATEQAENNLFASVCTASKTMRDTLFLMVDTLTEAPDPWKDPLGEAVYYGAAKSVDKALSQLLADRAKLMGENIVPRGERAEIMATVDSCVTCVTRLCHSFVNTRSDPADMLDEAKAGATAVSQLCQAADETFAKGDLGMSHDKLRASLVNLVEAVRDSHNELLDVVRSVVAFKGDAQHAERLNAASRKVLDALTQLLAAVLCLAEVNLAEVQNRPHVITKEFASQAAKLVEAATPEPPPSPPDSSDTAPSSKSSEATYDDNVNIWDEPPEANVVYTKATEDGANPVLRAGSLNKLVESLTSPSFKDVVFMHAFVTTYRSFTSPSTLFTKLTQRYEVPESASANRVVIQSRVLNVMRYWVDNRFGDFDPQLLARMRRFMETVKQGDSSAFAGIAGSALSAIERQERAKDVSVDNLVIQPKVPIRPSRLLFVFSEEEVAKQLTLLDMRAFSAVEPAELLGQAWSKKDRQHVARNIHVLVRRSNRVTFWVSSLLLWQPTLKERIRVLTKVVNIAIHLYRLHNFNGLMSIVSALNNAAIHRLKHTFDGLSPDLRTKLDEMCQVLSPGQAYANYRRALYSVNPPCIPFLGVYLTDLTFKDDGNPDFLDGLINFSKRKLIHATIQEIQQYQQSPYPIDYVDSLATYLRELPCNTEDDLFNLSLMREPRGATTVT